MEYLKRQVGSILSSIYTNGFIISKLTYQYKEHNIAKLYNCVIHISQLFPFFHFENRALSGLPIPASWIYRKFLLIA
jgi:hypothetical protein